MAWLDVAGAMRDIFTAIYPELGDIQGERIRKAIKDSFVEQGWGDAEVDQSELIEPPFSRFVEILRTEPKPDRGLKTLLSRLEELDDYGFFQSADKQESLWESEQPVVLRIHSTQNDNLQKAFASLGIKRGRSSLISRKHQRHQDSLMKESPPQVRLSQCVFRSRA